MKILVAVGSRQKVVITLVLSLLVFSVFIFNLFICWEACKISKTIIQAPTFPATKEACIIPKTPDMPEYFRKGWRPPKNKFNCSYERRLTSIENEKDLRLLWDWSKVNSSCCLQEVLRMRRDTSYIFSTCNPMPPHLRLTYQEAFLIKCSSYLNIEATISDLPQVQEKRRYWDQIQAEAQTQDDLPYSVLLLGIDTVSQAHMHRSAPKAVKLLKDMGFLEFDSFHSVGPSTLANFNAALMGLTTAEVRQTCAPDWTSPFDPCPLIWNNFSARKYITGYIEDGFQTFNWGGQSGFNKAPTDYYFPQLFQVLTHFRERQFKQNRTLEENYGLECASSETTPEFMWRYVLRFVKKFERTPYLFFSFNANPFHKDTSSLTHFSTPFENFLEKLQAHKVTMEKTIILLFTDHGDRRGLLNSDSVSSYYERLHPALYIRLPSNLHRTYHEALASNSKKFVTPFDIHQTLLHILDLTKTSKGHSSETNFQGTTPADARSSLLLNLRPDRTCSNTNIPREHCICNGIYPEEELAPGKKHKNNNNNNNNTDMRAAEADEELKLSLLHFIVQELNFKVRRSAFRDKCQDWSSSVENIRWLRMINRNGTQDEYVISFGATPKPARFDGRIRVTWGNGRHLTVGIQRLELVGITRSNEYGRQSWCIDKVSSEGKKLREFCFCKPKNESGKRTGQKIHKIISRKLIPLK